jgi:hypothetical protein
MDVDNVALKSARGRYDSSFYPDRVDGIEVGVEA